MGLISYILNHDTRVGLKNIGKIADKVLELSPIYEKMSEEELKGQTAVLKGRLQKGESLDKILPDAFATVREASYRVLKMRHYKVQLIKKKEVHAGLHKLFTKTWNWRINFYYTYNGLWSTSLP